MKADSSTTTSPRKSLVCFYEVHDEVAYGLFAVGLRSDGARASASGPWGGKDAYGSESSFVEMRFGYGKDESRPCGELGLEADESSRPMEAGPEDR